MNSETKVITHFKTLILLSKNILSESEKITFKSGKNKILKSLKSYEMSLKLVEANEHIEILRTLYNECKTFIERGIDDLNWLKDSNIKIIYGDEKDGIIINVSYLFKCACDIEHVYMENNKNNPVKKICTLPYEFALIFFKLLKAGMKPKEVESLNGNIGLLKEKLNKSNTMKVNKQNKNQNPLSSILNLMKPMLQTTGIDIKTDDINTEDIFGFVAKILNDNKIKSIIDNIKTNGIKSPEDLITNVTNILDDESIKKQISEGLENETNIIKNNKEE